MMLAPEINKILHENKQNLDEIVQLKLALETAQEKIQWFEEQFKLLRHRQFAKKSEASSTFQYKMIFEADEGLPPPEENPTPEPAITVTTTRKKNKTQGRNIDTLALPRIQEHHDLSDDQKDCQSCGHALHLVTTDIREQLEIIPRQVYVVEHHHPQYSCRQCQTMVAADKPVAPLPKAMAGASLLTDVIVNKYESHLPLYRQSKIFKNAHIDIPDNTLGNWVMQSGEALLPLDTALLQELARVCYLQVDETPVKLLSPEKQAYMWCYLSPLPAQRLVRFRFDLTRSKIVPEQDLQGFKGKLQTDGYVGYQSLREQADISAFGCLSHCRRKFIEIIKIAGVQTSGKAQEALAFITALYALERQARDERLIFTQRQALRQEKAKPILESFYHWLVQTQPQAPPQSALRKAIDYSLNQWPYLQAYVDHGDVEVDTNEVENQIRPFALGRRNWLFVGNAHSASISALLYSLIQSAKLNHFNPRFYIQYVLTQVHELRKNNIDPVSLLPHRLDPKKLEQFTQNYFDKLKALFPALA